MKTLFLAFLLISSSAFAKISELASYKDLDLSQIDQNTLVIFDIDNTLLRQDSMIGTHQWGDYIRERGIRRGLTPQAASELQHKSFGDLQPYVHVVPVEAGIPEMLKSLKDRQIPHFALTARGPVLRKTTLRQIRILKHDFSQSFPEQKDLSVLGDHLEAGVIFSGSVSKGELLKRILNNSVKPVKKIIFIDDRKYNLDSVETSLADSGIELVSLRYGGADQFVRDFNPKIADIIYSYYLERFVMISDKEAASLLIDVEQLSLRRLEWWLGNEESPHGCSLESDESDRQIYICGYWNDQLYLTRKFEYTKDAFTGGFYFGNW